MRRIVKVTRRDLLVAGAAGGVGLALGFFVGRWHERGRVTARSQPFSPNAFLALDKDGTVTVWVTKSEMGQGVRTSLPMLVAEEMEADWSRVRIRQAELHPQYGNQGTASSTSIRTLWDPLRQAGATAREMLRHAAAETWSVGVETCSARAGWIVHDPSGRRLAFGELAVAAARQEVPTSVTTKTPDRFRILGRPTRRLDTPEKVDGTAVFGLDMRIPGMLHAAVLNAPLSGGGAQKIDGKQALEVEGVVAVLPVRGGVAVVAKGTWAALKGRENLRVTWERDPDPGLSDETVTERLRLALDGPGLSARRDGDPEAAIAAAATRVEATYWTPYLAHAAMEPINCTARFESGSCEIWAPTQSPAALRAAAADVLGLRMRDVAVHTTLLGGGFGRRVETIEAVQAAQLAKETGRPVQVVWPREEDIRHDFYRPASVHRLVAGLDPSGKLTCWTHRIASPTIADSKGMVMDGVDPYAVEGAADLPYGVPSVAVEHILARGLGVPCGFWRSVAHSSNAFAVECFVDEVAAAAGVDPVAFRLQRLADAPRHRAVLERVAALAGWPTPSTPGHHLGVALHASFGSYVGQVAEVSVSTDGAIRVHRVVCVVDCGRTVNPDTIVAQVEGGIVFGLSAALHGRITLRAGEVIESNFHDYRVLKMSEMPEIVVEILPSQEPPGGVGEIAGPPAAPAVANAVSAALGQRIRRLPMQPPE